MNGLLKEALQFLDGAHALIENPDRSDVDCRRARTYIAEAVERINAAMLRDPVPPRTVQGVERQADATGRDFVALLGQQLGTAIEYLDHLDDLPPHRVSWGIVGAVTSGTHQFPLRRDDYVDQVDVANFTSHIVDAGLLGQVDVERSGQFSDGPWSVDPYRSQSAPRMTPDEARRFAHALLGAADLADQLNGEGVQA